MKRKIILSEKRKGEMAYAMLIEDLRRKQHTLLRTDILKKIGNFSKKLSPLKIDKGEILILYRDIISEIVQSAFGQKYFWEKNPNKNLETLSPERKGEIAIQVWKLNIKEKNFSLDANEFERKIGNVMQFLTNYGFTKEEVISLYKEMAHEAMQEIFRETFTL